MARSCIRIRTATTSHIRTNDWGVAVPTHPFMNPQYIAETTKSPAQAVTDLQASVKQHGYGVLHIYDLKETLASKGFDLPNACHILEVCNPKTLIGMVRPTVLLSSLSKSEDLKAIAEQVEKDTIAIIEAAK